MPPGRGPDGIGRVKGMVAFFKLVLWLSVRLAGYQISSSQCHPNTLIIEVGQAGGHKPSILPDSARPIG